MNVQTSTPAPHRPTARRTRSATAPAHHPTAYAVDHPEFWLALWLRKSEQIDAVVAFRRDNQRRLLTKKKSHTALIDGWWYAETLMRLDTRTALDYVLREGKLLFAWVGTTRLQEAA